MTDSKVNKIIKALASNFRNDVLENGEENSCVVVYKTYTMSDKTIKTLYKIYKSIEIFEAKAESDFEAVDKIYGIDIELYSFD